LIVASQFDGQIGLNGGQIVLFSSKPDIVIYKVDRATNIIAWYKRFGGTAEKYLTRLVVDGSDHIYFLGEYKNGNISFGAQWNTIPDDNLFNGWGSPWEDDTDESLVDSLLVKLNPSGEILWGDYYVNNEFLRMSALSLHKESGSVGVTGGFSSRIAIGSRVVPPNVYPGSITANYGTPGVTSGIATASYDFPTYRTNSIRSSPNIESQATDLYNVVKSIAVKDQAVFFVHIGDRVPSTGGDQMAYVTRWFPVTNAYTTYDITSAGTTEAITITVDVNGDYLVIVKAQVAGTLTINNNGPAVQKQVGKPSSFLIKYNAELTVQWVVEIEADGEVDATGLTTAVQPELNIYVAGTVTKNNNRQGFIAQVSSNGVQSWLQIVATGNVQVFGEVLSYSRNYISIAGSYTGAVSIGGSTLTTASSFSGFAARFLLSGELIIEKTCSSGLTCGDACCEWVPPGGSSSVQQCYDTRYYVCTKNLPSTSAKCLCPTSAKACCNGACYNPDQYRCCSGTLKHISQAC
jgi:hypothetical protein